MKERLTKYGIPYDQWASVIREGATRHGVPSLTELEIEYVVTYFEAKSWLAGDEEQSALQTAYQRLQDENIDEQRLDRLNKWLAHAATA